MPRWTYHNKVVYGSLLCFALLGTLAFAFTSDEPSLDYTTAALFYWYMLSMGQFALTMLAAVVVAVVTSIRGSGTRGGTRSPDPTVLDGDPAPRGGSRSRPLFLAAGLILLIGNSLCLGIFSR